VDCGQANSIGQQVSGDCLTFYLPQDLNDVCFAWGCPSDCAESAL